VYSEDLAVFFTLKENGGLAEPGVYDGATVAVLFDAAYLEQVDGMVGNTEPAATGMASIFLVSAVGKTLAIDGVTYRIRTREPQDDGATVLMRLEKT